MGILNLFYSKKDPKPIARNAIPQKTENHVVVGLKYYEKSLMALAVENPNYKLDKKAIIAKKLTEQTIFKYNFNCSRVLLKEEPDNPHDPNAIQVIVDDFPIGHIKKGSCSHVKKLLNSGNITYITIEKLRYGESKCVTECREEGHFEVEKDFCHGYAVISINYNES